jgi:hypothetical protein
VFLDLLANAAWEKARIRSHWDPILKNVKKFEEKLQYFFLARWQWDEISAKFDLTFGKSKW